MLHLLGCPKEVDPSSDRCTCSEIDIKSARKERLKHLKVIYSEKELKQLSVGDEVVNCFGSTTPITRFSDEGRNEDGKYFRQFYQKFGTTAEIRETLVADQPVLLVI